MMLCYSKTFKFYFKENQILFGPPPPPTRLKDTNGRDMSTRTSVCLYNQPVTWID